MMCIIYRERFLTCNPKRTGYMISSIKSERGTLEEGYAFVPALVQDNPFATEDYINSLKILKTR